MLIAVAGFAGVGKTTAINFLESKSVGRQIYVGQYLRQEVIRRGLELNAQNERVVRQDMRSRLGPDVFAKSLVRDLNGKLPSNETILVDAIYVREEADCYRAAFGCELIVIGLQASFDVRMRRLQTRPERPLTTVELMARDALEKKMGMTSVVEKADHILSNEGELSDFLAALTELPFAQAGKPA